MKRFAKWYFILALILLFAGGLLWIVLPVRTFSEMENRCLKTWPEVNETGIRTGEVQEQLTNAANDQFVFRDFWMKNATAMQKILGLHDANGVYFGKDSYYLEKVLDTDFPEERYIRNVGYVEDFAEKTQFNVAVLLVPTAGAVLSEKLPKHAVFYDADARYREGQKNVMAGNWIDIRERLKAEKTRGQIFFRTDHHWTTYGAYQAYCVYMEQLGETVHSYEYFKPESISDSFYGTLYSKAPVKIEADELIVPQNIPDCYINIDGEETNSIYVPSVLNKKDKYGVYFGGNYGRIEIENKEIEEGETLVIIKDSYANSLVPYLMSHYKKIIMLDLRYYNESVQETVEQEHPSRVLILYEMSRFAQDSNLFKLGR